MERRTRRGRADDVQRRTLAWAVLSIVVLLSIIGVAVYLEKLTAPPEPFELVPPEERGAARRMGAPDVQGCAPEVGPPTGGATQLASLDRAATVRSSEPS